MPQWFIDIRNGWAMPILPRMGFLPKALKIKYFGSMIIQMFASASAKTQQRIQNPVYPECPQNEPDLPSLLRP